MYGEDFEDRPPATEAEAHVEWHLNSGVPMGQPCPWDVCDPGDDPAVRYEANQQRHDGALDEEPPTPEEQAEIDRQATEAARYEPPEETHWEHEMRDEPDIDEEAPQRRQSDDPDYDEAEQQAAEEPPCTDPRPDPRTHPEYWTE